MKQKILDIDPSEEVELVVKRHSIGLIPIFGFGLLITVLFVGFSIFASTNDTIIPAQLPNVLISIFMVVLAGLTLVGTLISARIYKTNELIVTNENLIQIIQTSLFSRKISQLSLEKVQDVTVTQQGMSQTMFNYGTIFIETAGETANFGFPYAKDPITAAKHVNEAHERFIKKFGIDVV